MSVERSSNEAATLNTLKNPISYQNEDHNVRDLKAAYTEIVGSVYCQELQDTYCSWSCASLYSNEAENFDRGLELERKTICKPEPKSDTSGELQNTCDDRKRPAELITP